MTNSYPSCEQAGETNAVSRVGSMILTGCIMLLAFNLVLWSAQNQAVGYGFYPYIRFVSELAENGVLSSRLW